MVLRYFSCRRPLLLLFSFTHTAPTETYTLSLHDALPICDAPADHVHRSHGRSPLTNFTTSSVAVPGRNSDGRGREVRRSEEHTSELQSLRHLVCRLLLEKKKRKRKMASKKK